VSRFERAMFCGGCATKSMIFLTASSSGMLLAISGLHRLQARYPAFCASRGVE
jgi:hypothetical protein